MKLRWAIATVVFPVTSSSDLDRTDGSGAACFTYPKTSGDAGIQKKQMLTDGVEALVRSPRLARLDCTASNLSNLSFLKATCLIVKKLHKKCKSPVNTNFAQSARHTRPISSKCGMPTSLCTGAQGPRIDENLFYYTELHYQI